MAMGDTYWTSLPTALHPRTVPIITAFVLRHELPSKDEAALVGLNLVGYAARQIGFEDGLSAAAPTHEDEIAAVQALETAQNSEGFAAAAIPWATLLGIAIKLLQALFTK